MAKAAKKKLTQTSIEKTLHSDAYWLASCGGDTEDIVFHIPQSSTKITVTTGQANNKSCYYVVSDVAITSCCSYTKRSLTDPVIIFPADTLVEISKDQFDAMCTMFSQG